MKKNTEYKAKASGLAFIGKTKYGGYVELSEYGHNVYQPVAADENSTEHDCIECVGSYTVKNVFPLTKKDKAFLEEAWKCDFLSCEECGFRHDGDDSQPDFRIVDDCEVYCLECVPADKKLLLIEDASDLFKAPRVDKTPQGYAKVDELFCDSSGFGYESGPALTKRGATEMIEVLMKQHKGVDLYAGITGVGQFQVYVTLYIKKQRKAKRAYKATHRTEKL